MGDPRTDNIASVPYDVQTAVYEGPFDLLLHLVLSSQVDVYAISLSAIVDAFVAELEHIQDLDITTEFVLVAATLIELKTRGLLPGREDVELDDEFALWEERDLLLARLLECKTFKDAAAALSRLAGLAGRSHPRTAGLEEPFLELAPDLLTGVTPEKLHQAYLRATTPRPVPRVDLEHVAPIRASVADAVAELVDELPELGRATFRRLTVGLTTSLAVIVRFLAVLELCKQGLVELDQAANFAELHVTWTGAAELDRSTIEEYQG